MKPLILLAVLPFLASCEGFKITGSIPISFKLKDGSEVTIPITLGQPESAKAPREVAP